MTLFIVSVVVFVLTQALGPGPGDPRSRGHAGAVLAKQQELGLDQPLDAVLGLVERPPHRRSGVSFTNGVPVMDVIGDRIWNSLFLLAVAAVMSIPISIAIGA